MMPTFFKDRSALSAGAVITVYALVALAGFAGLLPSWESSFAAGYQAPSFERLSLWFGTDMFGRSVLLKVLYGAGTAIHVGIVSCLISVPLGIVMGALAGYFGRWVDAFVVWLYTVLSSVPQILLIMAIAFVLGKGIFALYIALGTTTWVTLARVVRAEFISQKRREYVVAAESLGASHFRRIFKHILPNVSHFAIINLSVQFIGAIKAEVVLSFLGLGAQQQPSWGVMIDDAKLELVRGIWWQLAGAGVAMFVLILCLNIFGDALRDALDVRSGADVS